MNVELCLSLVLSFPVLSVSLCSFLFLSASRVFLPEALSLTFLTAWVCGQWIHSDLVWVWVWQSLFLLFFFWKTFLLGIGFWFHTFLLLFTHRHFLHYLLGCIVSEEGSVVILILHFYSAIWNILFVLPAFLIFPLSLLFGSLNRICLWFGDSCGRGAFLLLGVLWVFWDGCLVSVIHFRSFLYIISSYCFFLACQSHFVRSFIYMSLGCSAVFFRPHSILPHCSANQCQNCCQSSFHMCEAD